MKINKITADIARELLNYEPDTGIFYWKERDSKWFPTEQSWRTWNTRFSGTVAGRHNVNKYMEISVLGRRYRSHRLAWLISNGEWPAEQIDHINGDPIDNRLSNLRAVTNFENQKNRKMSSRNSSGFRGVFWNKRFNTWQAGIGINNKLKHLGYFKTAELASEAYIAAALENGYTTRHIYGQSSLPAELNTCSLDDNAS